MVYCFIPTLLGGEPKPTFVHNELHVDLTWKRAIQAFQQYFIRECDTLYVNVHPLCNSTIIHHGLLEYLCVIENTVHFL